MIRDGAGWRSKYCRMRFAHMVMPPVPGPVRADGEPILAALWLCDGGCGREVRNFHAASLVATLVECPALQPLQPRLAGCRSIRGE